MSFDAKEKSGYGAQPYELYLFQSTGLSFALTSAENAITYLGQVYGPATITRTGCSRCLLPSIRSGTRRRWSSNTPPHLVPISRG